MSLNEFQIATLQASRDAHAPREASLLDLLTATQLRVVHHLSRGATNAEIARALGVSEAAVKKQLSSVYATLGVRNRVRLIARLFGG